MKLLLFFVAHVLLMLASIAREVFFAFAGTLKTIAKALWLALEGPWIEIQLLAQCVAYGEAEWLLNRLRELVASDLESWRSHPREDPAETERRSRLRHPELWRGRE